MGLAHSVLITAVSLQLLCRPALAQEEDLAVEHQGIARHVLLHMPSAAPANKLPAVIYLHGVRPADWKNHTQREIDTLADRDGVLAAYPEAIGHRWNYATAIKDPQKSGTPSPTISDLSGS